MLKTFLILTLLAPMALNAQSKGSAECKIEIYLLKKRYPNYDTIRKQGISFVPLKQDLQDTAFIKDSEFVSLTVEKIKYRHKGKKLVRYRHSGEFLNSLDDRMKPLNLPVRLTEQFALVINGQVIYGGYFLWEKTSLMPFGVCAFVHGSYASFQYGYKGVDPRNDKVLLNCLKESNRLNSINGLYSR